MRRYISIIILCLVVSISIPMVVKGDDYYVTGFVKLDDETPVQNMEVSLTNIETNETIYANTNANGAYIFDLSDLDQGFDNGDYALLMPGSYEGYKGYGSYVVLDDSIYIYHGNLLMYPKRITESGSDVDMLWMSVANREESETNFNLLVNPCTTLVSDSGDTEMYLAAGYGYWDDAKTNLTNGLQYDINITYTIDVWEASEYYAGFPFDSDTNTLSYTVTGGGAQKQSDPWLYTTVTYEYDDVELVFVAYIHCIVKTHFTQQTVAHWENDITIEDIVCNFV